MTVSSSLSESLPDAQEDAPTASHTPTIPAGLTGTPKRLFDIAMASSMLLFFSPFLLIAALAIKLQGGGPVLFKHRRIGRNGEAFTLFKFRTMRVDADAVLEKLLAEDDAARAYWEEFRKLPDDPRVTPIGKFLRRASLDEFPQLLNVLRGDMSIVGPRPVTDSELSRYGTYQSAYEAARPGLTGLWQVSGRNRMDFDSRVKLDVMYIRDWSLLKDIKLIIRTIPAVLVGTGAY